MESKKAKGPKLPEIKLPAKQKKVILIAILILGFGIMLAGYKGIPTSNDTMRVDEQINEIAPVSYTSAITQAEAALEKRLVEILSQMNGVGKISVSVAYKESPEYEYAVNVSTSEKSITETDQSGGNRVTLDTTETGNLVLIRSASNTGENPVVVKEIKPEILGVLVVAEGASSPMVKAELTRAVQTLLGINLDQVNVVSGVGR
ncbi:MAG: hypothetical protein APF76_07885 [Desulfitibacter sp. BRH_c19]|nr:MAG: hypothetical protein APF76_07885 [Desulfitibacter sp. BRH_c19]